MKLSSFNQTAYRILLLLLWLSETPLTFHEINERFEGEIGKKVSQDTFWLYLNTLKALGCEISRPTRRNGFCYKLLYHPFTFFLTSQDVRVLKDSLARTEDSLELWDFIHFNGWVNRLFERAANKNREELAQQFFDDVRCVNLEALQSQILGLEYYCQKQQLLCLVYDSPKNGHERLTVLPQKLFHHHRNLYLLVQSDIYEKPSMLRLDKIEDFQPIDDPALFEILHQRQQHKQVFLVRLLLCAQAQYEGLGEEEEIIPDPSSPQHLLIKLSTNNEFLLKQKLLSSGYRFQILHPQDFRETMDEELREMRQLYL